MHRGLNSPYPGMYLNKYRLSVRGLCFLLFISLFLLIYPAASPQAGNNMQNFPGKYHFRQFTVDDGLSQNLISAIYQDQQGFLWIGTKDGLNMFDGYNFRIFNYDFSDETTLSDNYITAIYEDTGKRLWVGTFRGGLHYLDRRTMRFECFSHEPGNINSISGNHIQAIVGDNDGNLWVGTNGRGLNKLVFEDESAHPGKDNVKIIRYDGPENGFPEINTRITALFVDNNNRIWAGTSSGIFIHNLKAEAAIASFDFVEYSISLSEDQTDSVNIAVRAVFADSNGDIWIGNNHGVFILNTVDQLFVRHHKFSETFPAVNVLSATVLNNQGTEEIWIGTLNGIFVLNPLTGDFKQISRDIYPESGLQRGNIISLLSCKGGSLWLGSNGYGLSVYSPGSRKFVHANDLVYEGIEGVHSSRDLSIRSFILSPDDSNTLWIGANRGLFKVNRTTSVMTRVKFSLSDEPGNSMVFSLQKDDTGFIWIGSGNGLTRFNPADNSYRLFPLNLTFPGEGFETRVSYVHINKGDIWVLTQNTIARFDPETGNYVHTRYDHDPLDEFREAAFPRIYEDMQGNFWITARNGLHYFDVGREQISSFPIYPAGTNRPGTIDIKCLIPDPEDPDHYLWLGTGGGGLIRYDIESAVFTAYNMNHGLASNTVYGMLYDNNGSIWLSTNRGLSRFIISKEYFINYTRADGLQSNEFNSGAFYMRGEGEMFFGGIYGYNNFRPSEIRLRDYNPPLVFTLFRVLNENRDRDPGSYSDLMPEDGRINLTHRQNDFTVEFASLDFVNPARISYAFSMTTEGENWINTGHTRSITFTDLNPGIYTLRVRGTNSDGILSNREASITIAIRDPWWKHSWLLFVYLSAIAGIIAGMRKYEMSRIHLRNSIRIANIETRKLKEVDQLKSQFFANISHEFRTPLTLIKGPLEELRENEEDLNKKESLKMVITNASRLLQLINQLLDLSRLENDNYSVKAGRGDILAFTRGVVYSFASLAEKKSITLRIEVTPELEINNFTDNFYYDPDILEKIFNNLLSNALRFTSEKGSIIVGISSQTGEDKSGWLEFIISDTGIGIPQDQLPYIYDRFFQVNTGSVQKSGGAGIGLSYVKELVRVHKAEIYVESRPGTGTTFRLRFPMGKDHFDSGQVINLPYEPTPKNMPGPELPGDHIIYSRSEVALPGAPCILIVEDNTEVRNYIAESLRNNYRVAECSNATDGFAIAEELMPDLIISDIMMPGTDGFEFCNLIKSNNKTSHIPVILLTARAEDTDRIRGLGKGADDYLTKPFNVRELLSRVGNIIDNRRVLREKFSTQSIIKPNEISATPRDASFIEEVMRVVENNIANTAFSVDDLAKVMIMSPSQLHRKLKATVNITANHFIRSVRMNRALELLRNNAGNIAEVAYMVGYDDPGYFTKSFRNFFGKLPSEINRK